MNEISNSEFLAAIYRLSEGEFGWTASFIGDPGQAGPSEWKGQAWRCSDQQRTQIDTRPAANNYYCVAVMNGPDLTRTKVNFERLAVLFADDVNPSDLLDNAAYALETSPGNYQAGVMLDDDDPDTRDLHLIDALLQAMAVNGLVKADRSGNNPVRYARLPVGSNTKARPSGPFQTVMRNPLDGAVYSLADAAATFGLDLEAIRAQLGSVPVGQSPRADAADLYRALLHSDPTQRSYHGPLLQLSSSLVASGLQPHAALNHLRAIGEATIPANDNATEVSRHAERYGSELARMVAGASKYAPAEPVFDNEPLIQPLRDLANEVAKTRWIVKGIIPSNAMGMIFGASGSFKSFIAFDLAFHVANDMEWAGLRTKDGPTLYVAAEGGGGAYRRGEAWCQARGREMHANFYICKKPLMLSDEQQLAKLRGAIKALPAPPSLIVIDTLAQTFDGDENASSVVSAYLRQINSELREPFGATVVVVHHTGHNDEKRPRGSSAFTANLDFVLKAVRPSEDAMQSKLTVTKMRDGERLNDLHFAVTKEHLGFDEDGDAISSLVATHEPAPRAGRMVQLSDAEWRKVQDVVSRGVWRASSQAADYVGHAFEKALGIAAMQKAQIFALYDQGIADGLLKVERRPVAPGGRQVPFVIVGDWIEP